MTIVVPAFAGALVVAGLIGAVIGLRPAPTSPSPRERAGTFARAQAVSRRTKVLVVAGLGAGLIAWLATGWILAVVLVPVAAVGLPVLLSAPPEATRIKRLEAMEEWTRALAGVLTVGVGLEQALVATLRSTPAPIAGEVGRLVARLRARWSTEDALRAFADELHDSTGDLVAANLILGARRRGAGLANVLEGLAESVAADARARRQVEADREKPRSTARWVTLISASVLVLLALSGSYVEPYRTPLGQVILVVLLAAYISTLVWMRQMAIGRPLPRFLDTERAREMTGLQLMLVSGGLLGLGAALLAIRLVPAQPDLGDVLARLTPSRTNNTATVPAAMTGKEKVGVWAMRALPPGLWVRTPHRELALLRIPLARFYGEKLTFAALGLVIPPLLNWFFGLLGVGLPVAIPAIASLGLAAAMFFLPNFNAIGDARGARIEFARALGAYIELVALERNNGAGVRQSMETAAEIGDSWVFTRLGEELTRSRWSGVPPWDALHALAEELGLPELDDFADIMRLSGEEGARVYATLRARSAAMRTAMLNDEVAEANAIGERMTIPGSLLGVIFMALLVAPSLLRMFTSS